MLNILLCGLLMSESFLSYNPSNSIRYHKLNTAPFNKPNTNDEITGRKLHSVLCCVWHIVVWDHFRGIRTSCIISKCRIKVGDDLMAREAFILTCISWWSILFSPICDSLTKCQSWLLERIAIFGVSPALCVTDTGTWGKHAALVELAFSPCLIEDGIFIVVGERQNCIDMKKWLLSTAC